MFMPQCLVNQQLDCSDLDLESSDDISSFVERDNLAKELILGKHVILLFHSSNIHHHYQMFSSSFHL